MKGSLNKLNLTVVVQLLVIVNRNPCRFFLVKLLILTCTSIMLCLLPICIFIYCILYFELPCLFLSVFKYDIIYCV